MLMNINIYTGLKIKVKTGICEAHLVTDVAVGHTAGAIATFAP